MEQYGCVGGSRCYSCIAGYHAGMALLSLICAYLLGSIPFGLLVAKATGVGDPRQQGSGNIGATNLVRVGGKKLGLLTLLLDAGKGAAAVWIAKFHGSEALTAWAGFLAVIGHCFPVWLRFKGGRGVSTALAVLLFYLWPVGLFACSLWLGIFALTRTSSLASLIAIGSSPVYALLLAGGMGTPGFLLTLGLAILITARHRANIGRLLRGKEKSFK